MDDLRKLHDILLNQRAKMAGLTAKSEELIKFLHELKQREKDVQERERQASVAYALGNLREIELDKVLEERESIRREILKTELLLKGLEIASGELTRSISETEQKESEATIFRLAEIFEREKATANKAVGDHVLKAWAAYRHHQGPTAWEYFLMEVFGRGPEDPEMHSLRTSLLT